MINLRFASYFSSFFHYNKSKNTDRKQINNFKIKTKYNNDTFLITEKQQYRQGSKLSYGKSCVFHNIYNKEIKSF